MTANTRSWYNSHSNVNNKLAFQFKETVQHFGKTIWIYCMDFLSVFQTIFATTLHKITKKPGTNDQPGTCQWFFMFSLTWFLSSFFSFLSRTNKCETMAFLLIRLTGLIYFWDKFASLSLVKNRKEHRAVDHWTMGEFSQRWGWGWEWSRAGLHSRQTERRTGRYTDRQGISWLGTGSQ